MKFFEGYSKFINTAPTIVSTAHFTVIMCSIVLTMMAIPKILVGSPSITEMECIKMTAQYSKHMYTEQGECYYFHNNQWRRI